MVPYIKLYVSNKDLYAYISCHKKHPLSFKVTVRDTWMSRFRIVTTKSEKGSSVRELFLTPLREILWHVLKRQRGWCWGSYFRTKRTLYNMWWGKWACTKMLHMAEDRDETKGAGYSRNHIISSSSVRWGNVWRSTHSLISFKMKSNCWIVFGMILGECSVKILVRRGWSSMILKFAFLFQMFEISIGFSMLIYYNSPSYQHEKHFQNMYIHIFPHPHIRMN